MKAKHHCQSYAFPVVLLMISCGSKLTLTSQEIVASLWQLTKALLWTLSYHTTHFSHNGKILQNNLSGVFKPRIDLLVLKLAGLESEKPHH